MEENHWVYWPLAGKWRNLKTGEWGSPQKGDWYRDGAPGEWRIW